MRERQRETERGRQRETERQRDREMYNGENSPVTLLKGDFTISKHQQVTFAVESVFIIVTPGLTPDICLIFHVT